MANWCGNRGKKAEGVPDPATNRHPGRETSPWSRAIEGGREGNVDSKKEDEDLIQIVLVSPDGTKTDGPVDTETFLA
jgi:hypothetical protein